MLLRRSRWRDLAGRVTSLTSRRLVHMAQPHLAAIRLEIVAENWSGGAVLRSLLDGRVVNTGVARYRQLEQRHLEPMEAGGGGADGPSWLRVRFCQSRLEVAEAARTAVHPAAAERSDARRTLAEPGLAGEEIGLELVQGEAVTVEKVVALFTSRDRAISECGLAARQAAATAPGWDALLAAHERAWASLWRRADVQASDHVARRTTLLLRLHAFHLMQTVSPNSADLDVGVPARGLHGEGYRGHLFWDELFIFPFFTLRFPEQARSLLLYRYRRLGAARRLAAAAGLRGAMFPWQSGSDGREESQHVHLNPASGRWLPDHTHLQRHVNCAIAWNVCQYVSATGDAQFLDRFGAEMILDICRFLASLCTWNAARRRFDMRGVMGPDEYHDGYPDADRPGVDNNAYTNLMAVWTLCRGLAVLQQLPADRAAELREALGLDAAELARWEAISRRMFVPFHDGDVISQFEGYERLAEFDWQGYRARYGNIRRLDRILEAEGDHANRYRLSKQADVLMLFYLMSAPQLTALLARLGYDFQAGSIPRNVEYYLARTAHGSTLSQVVHSWVLSRSDRARSWEHFLAALESDALDSQGGTTAEGIHLGAMAATLDLVQHCYSGLTLGEDGLALEPCLPEGLTRLCFPIVFRDLWLEVSIDERAVLITPERPVPQPLAITVEGVVHHLVGNRPLRVPLA